MFVRTCMVLQACRQEADLTSPSGGVSANLLHGCERLHRQQTALKTSSGSQADVGLTGQTGGAKRTVARAPHEGGPRRDPLGRARVAWCTPPRLRAKRRMVRREAGLLPACGAIEIANHADLAAMPGEMADLGEEHGVPRLRSVGKGGCARLALQLGQGRVL